MSKKEKDKKKARLIELAAKHDIKFEKGPTYHHKDPDRKCNPPRGQGYYAQVVVEPGLWLFLGRNYDEAQRCISQGESFNSKGAFQAAVCN